ncbi:MAG: proliferating cell nuclear antigen (pcna) [Nitrososphaerota archaeon]|jgi:proliferating cell nuclear antigen|nr:proliferating cell nuclear antigen (pcna) [Nitrososphaerota archaeon]
MRKRTVFKLKVSDAKLLRDMATAISILIDEATFKIETNGLKLRAMDPSRVAMIDFEWPKTIFEEYVCTESTKMCINISELLKLLKRAGREESVELSLDDKTGRLQVKILGKYIRNFTMPTLEASEEEVPTPKISFNVKAKSTTAGLSQAIDDAQLVSDHVRIEADNEKLVLSATGDLMGATITLQKGSDALLDLEVKEASKATFSLSYLSEIIKAASATSDVATLEFSSDMPVYIDFQQTKEGKLTFFLAPRIETD